MIKIGKKISRKERKWLYAYIRGTPVGWLSCVLGAGAPAWHARITDLARTPTIFTDPKNGRHKQTVAERVASLPRDRKSKESWTKLKKYAQMVKAGQPLDLFVTVVRDERRALIADGNHRAMAAHMVGQKTLPCFYIDMRYKR